MSNKKEGYLRCRVSEGLFPNEYAVKFRQRNGSEAGCFVNCDNVKIIGKGQGLVKLVCKELSEDTAFIGLNDVADKRISFFLVPSSEVMYGK